MKFCEGGGCVGVSSGQPPPPKRWIRRRPHHLRLNGLTQSSLRYNSRMFCIFRYQIRLISHVLRPPTAPRTNLSTSAPSGSEPLPLEKRRANVNFLSNRHRFLATISSEVVANLALGVIPVPEFFSAPNVTVTQWCALCHQDSWPGHLASPT